MCLGVQQICSLMLVELFFFIPDRRAKNLKVTVKHIVTAYPVFFSLTSSDVLRLFGCKEQKPFELTYLKRAFVLQLQDCL